MANELITLTEFATWAQTTVEAIEADPFGIEVWEKSSELVKAVAERPDWTMETAPFQVRLLTLKIAKRTYTNPDQEVSTTTGPISARVLDIAAMAMDLSEEETELLEKHKPDGSGTDGLWILSTGRSPEILKSVYIPDDDQPNLGDREPWAIPYGDTLETDFYVEDGDTFI